MSLLPMVTTATIVFFCAPEKARFVGLAHLSEGVFSTLLFAQFQQVALCLVTRDDCLIHLLQIRLIRPRWR